MVQLKKLRFQLQLQWKSHRRSREASCTHNGMTTNRCISKLGGTTWKPIGHACAKKGREKLWGNSQYTAPCPPPGIAEHCEQDKWAWWTRSSVAKLIGGSSLLKSSFNRLMAQSQHLLGAREACALPAQAVTKSGGKLESTLGWLTYRQHQCMEQWPWSRQVQDRGKESGRVGKGSTGVGGWQQWGGQIAPGRGTGLVMPTHSASYHPSWAWSTTSVWRTLGRTGMQGIFKFDQIQRPPVRIGEWEDKTGCKTN